MFTFSRKISQGTILLLLTLMAEAAYAIDKVKLKKQGGIFGKFENFLQDIINFVQGPYALAVGFFGLVLAIGGWVFARDFGGVIAIALRMVAAVAALFSVGGLLSALGG